MHIGSTGEIDLSGSGDLIPGRLLPQQEAAISLPASLFERISDQTTVGVFYAFYRMPTLFPLAMNTSQATNDRSTRVGSRVLAATVGSGINFANLDEPVTAHLRLLSDIGVRMHDIVLVTVLYLQLL